MQPVFRFAPSPNGELHLGHAYSAVITSRLARQAGGRFLLRIEDIDRARAQAEYEHQIYDDLAWLGLEWERPVRRQSEHMTDYRAALERLMSLGVVYKSFATRGDIRQTQDKNARRDPDGQSLYPASLKYRDLAWAKAGNARPHAWRLDAQRAMELAAERAGATPRFFESASGPNGETGEIDVDLGLWGDPVIARKDIGTSYHLAVVVDDALQHVSHVTRGQDLFYASHIHRVLQCLLDLPEPLYHHHELIRDIDRRKLSKSDRDMSLRALRVAGASRNDVLAMIGLAAGA
jgi:glutamyl-Q tRNA(Asp) synthetase